MKATLKPIRLNAAEVQSLIESGKATVRRKMSKQPRILSSTFHVRKQKVGDLFVAPDAFPTDGLRGWVIGIATGRGSTRWMGQNFSEEYSPFAPIGSEFWVKERWGERWHWAQPKAFYAADPDDLKELDSNLEFDGWKTASSMPRWASRLSVFTASVRMEQVDGTWYWVAEMKRKDVVQ